MPGLYDISSTFFINLLNRLGVKPPPVSGFQLINTVQPVSIVDVDVQIPVSISDIVLGTPFSVGLTAAPVINTVLADTGPLAAGNWVFRVLINVGDGSAAFSRTALQHRNAANAANIWEQNYQTVSAQPVAAVDLAFTKSMALNERLRIINLIAGGGVSSYQGQIFAVQIA